MGRKRIALTGGIACGKSHVAATLNRFGIETLDADDIVHSLIPADERKRLAKTVFSNPAERKRLEERIHPIVRARIDAWLDDPKRAGRIRVAVIPLLFEAGWEKSFDRIICVTSPREAQIERMVKTRGYSVAEAEARIDAQMSVAEKGRRSDWVVCNDGDVDELEGKVRILAEKIKRYTGGRMKKSLIVAAVVAVVLGIGISAARHFAMRGEKHAEEVAVAQSGDSVSTASSPDRTIRESGDAETHKPVRKLAASADQGEQDTPTEDEQREAAEEKAVDDFDELVDGWMEGDQPKEVKAADIDVFMQLFARVPEDRKEECLQRALNLVPDENVMLLVAVLMDKRQPKELLELVFNDVLNREESVKEPILKRILSDKDHPCHDDAAWVLDASGEGDAKDE